jgi:CRISPR/Cas system-associated exonuclease Cas4 (RecB family)
MRVMSLKAPSFIFTSEELMQREQEYPKQIDTLVQDIYGLFEKPHTPDEKNLDEFLASIKSTVLKRMKEDPTQEREGYLRMSLIGKPDRQIWYQMRLDKEALKANRPNGQTHIKFMFGDIIEALLILLIKESGHTIENEQMVVSVNGVEGSMDFTVDGAVLDAKSASSYGIKKFRDGSIVNDDPFGYIGQISGYKNGVETKYGRKVRQGLLAMNKENAELVLCMIPEKHTIDVPQRIETLHEQLSQDKPPERCYKPKVLDNGNHELPKGCGWCAFKEMCWNDVNGGQGLRVFKYSNGPQFFTKVVNPPRVQEITNTYFKLPEDIED